jgi:hypothetical protein
LSKNHHRAEAKPARDWRRIHHSPLFWLGALLFLAAVTVYVLSDNLAWRPHVEQRAATPAP